MTTAGIPSPKRREERTQFQWEPQVVLSLRQGADGCMLGGPDFPSGSGRPLEREQLGRAMIAVG
jgi:hypothetical protein